MKSRFTNIPTLTHRSKEYTWRLWATASTRKRISWSIILVAAITLITLGPGKVTEEMNRPLGPTLPAPMSTNTPATRAPSMAPTGDPAPKPLCGGPEQMIILGAGVDRQSIEQDRTGLVDVIRVIRVDFVKGDISILAIPRDLWVEIPGLEGNTSPEGYFGYPIVDGEIIDQPGDHGRINASYFYGEYYDLPGGGPGILAQTLYHNFGLQVDHYAIADMQTFSEAIDAIGGVDVYLPEKLGTFKAGWHHMDGPTALSYSRIRSPDTDWDRIDRQSQVMLALGEQVLNSKNIASLPALANSFLDDIVTDLSKAELAGLTCLAAQASRDTITTYRIGPEMVTSVGTTRKASVMLPNIEAIHLLIADFMRNE
ncbi:MAG: LCP family protein [Anaerolineae bacterium]|nr:LCP family protein [Anaerolineae bacterium]